MLQEEIDADEYYANKERDIDNNVFTTKEDARCAPRTRRNCTMRWD